MNVLDLENSFKLIGRDWTLITAKNGEKVNTMTASWGGFGHLWNKDIVFIFIRPQRYTFDFVENSDYFTLTFFDEKFKKELGYLGRVSGRDEDKIKEVGFNIELDGEYAGFKEASLTIKCKKLFKQRLDENSFLDKNIVESCYPNKDFHYMYIGEIEKIENKNK